MSRLSFVFWNAGERRPRAVWRLLLYLLLVAIIANPLILLLDVTDNRLLENSLENVCIAAGFGFALVISARFLKRRSLKHYGLHFHRAWWAEIGLGFVLGGAIMGIAFVVLYFWQPWSRRCSLAYYISSIRGRHCYRLST